MTARTVPESLARDIEGLLGVVRGLDALAEHVGREYATVSKRWDEDAPKRWEEGEEYDDEQLATDFGMERLTASLGAVLARLNPTGLLPDAPHYLREHGFTGFGIDEEGTLEVGSEELAEVDGLAHLDDVGAPDYR